jgi:hypothetical protein
MYDNWTYPNILAKTETQLQIDKEYFQNMYA